MKKCASFLVFLLLIVLSISSYAQGVKFEKGINYSQALEKANREGKMLFIDFYTDWCIPCKQINQYLFNRNNIGKAVNRDFVSIRINAEKGEGIELARRFNVSGYPTLIFMKNDDTESCRFRGAPTNGAFFLEVLDIALGKKHDLPALYAIYEKSYGDQKIKAAQDLLLVASAYYSVKMVGEELTLWRKRCFEVSKYYFSNKNMDSMINSVDFDIISFYMNSRTSEDPQILYIYKNYNRFKSVVDQFDLATFVVNLNNRSIQRASKEGDLIWKRYVSYIDYELKEAYTLLGEKRPRETMDYVARVNAALYEKDYDRYLSVNDRYLKFVEGIGERQPGQYMYSAQTLLYQTKGDVTEKQLVKGLEWLNKNIEDNFNLAYTYMLMGDYYALSGKNKDAIASYNRSAVEAKKQGGDTYTYYVNKLKVKIKAIREKDGN